MRIWSQQVMCLTSWVGKDGSEGSAVSVLCSRQVIKQCPTLSNAGAGCDAVRVRGTSNVETGDLVKVVTLPRSSQVSDGL